MKDFAGRVAVVTGAASGIGRALAARFAAAGMKVVLADVEEQALAVAADELGVRGATVAGVPTDVSRASDVETLARRTLETFGAVHVVCNNAGVVAAGVSWQLTLADWEWVLGVNLWGVIHGVRTFVPILIDQKTEGHVVNTASLAGLVASPFNASYTVSKFGVVALSETLQHELALLGTPVRVSVLCPGWVNTRIIDAGRNRPASLAGEPAPQAQTEMERMLEATARQLLAAGLAPERVADRVFDAIRDERFYILTHPEFTPLVRTRMEDILEGRSPSLASLA
jgi:NAD(P)-dependent dehydrogenase (short-subunit alcohol dehydrogenase family)